MRGYRWRGFAQENGDICPETNCSNSSSVMAFRAKSFEVYPKHRRSAADGDQRVAPRRLTLELRQRAHPKIIGIRLELDPKSQRRCSEGIGIRLKPYRKNQRRRSEGIGIRLKPYRKSQRRCFEGGELAQLEAARRAAQRKGRTDPLSVDRCDAN